MGEKWVWLEWSWLWLKFFLLTTVTFKFLTAITHFKICSWSLATATSQIQKMAPHVPPGGITWPGWKDRRGTGTSSRWRKNYIKSNVGTVPKVTQSSYQELKEWTTVRPARALGYKYARRPPEVTSEWNFVAPPGGRHQHLYIEILSICRSGGLVITVPARTLA